jgi:hypothetical protein
MYSKKSFFRDLKVFVIAVAFLCGCALLAVKVVAFPAQASVNDVVVNQMECTDAGCDAIARAITPTGDLSRVFPRTVKGIADFKTMQVVMVPAKFLRFDSKDPQHFFNPYQADPIQAYKAGNRPYYVAITIGGSIIYGANRNRPNPTELYSIVRVIGDELTVFQVMR